MTMRRGRLTIPTDLDVIPETINLMERWGADAIRDADGTQFPKELQDVAAKVYATYYTTRRDNEWAKANPDEVQQCYIMSAFHAAVGEQLEIPIMSGYSKDLFVPNDHDDIKRWWEVVDRSTGEPLSPTQWEYQREDAIVVISGAEPYHVYTVSFLAYLIWDPVHMYNSIINEWDGVERQITFDVRQPKTKEYSKRRLSTFLEKNPHVSVVRFTTFFHQFTLMFDELRREKYVDWYGYSASVSPPILEQFEREVGYPFRPEYIIDQGYYNNQYRVPSKEFCDFMAFQRREVAALARELVDIVHEHKREAMMFLGDHWIGTEPYMEEFKTIGLDAVVGSVGNGSTLRLLADIEGVDYIEGRFLPYFFPDTFHEGGDPVGEARFNWITARRALLRSPIDRIGYGGYLKLAIQFPDFVDYVEHVANEFRELHEKVSGGKPYCAATVAVVNSWGKMRSWGCHMVHHAIYQRENMAYAGVIEALSGAPLDVRFLSFDDLCSNEQALAEIDAVILVGNAGTAHSGGDIWKNPTITTMLRRYVAQGGGIIGVGEPTGCQHQGRFFQLADVFAVEKETGLTLGYDKYNWAETTEHFITADAVAPIDFGAGGRDIYALEEAVLLRVSDRQVQLAAHDYGQGRSVYFSGLPYSFENSRLLLRAVLWASGREAELTHWYSSNCQVDVHAYENSRSYCVLNNTDLCQSTKVYTARGENFELELKPNEIKWFPMK